MKYLISYTASIALFFLIGAFVSKTASAAPALNNSAAAYLIPSPMSANGYMKPDDYN
jgi:ABC-type transport system involved in cytochrome bd biosynthesis fused ATPase/permease subunit